MAGAKEIRSKIASIKSTQKITNAMEKVAVSKMRKAQMRMAAGRPYAERIRQVIGHLANANPEYRHPFMVEREVKRVGYIVVSSDRGLAGGLNINLFKALVKDMSGQRDRGAEIDLCVIGSKGASFFKSYGGNVVAACCAHASANASSRVSTSPTSSATTRPRCRSGKASAASRGSAPIQAISAGRLPCNNCAW